MDAMVGIVSGNSVLTMLAEYAVQLISYASDIAKLSPGSHTLKCGYLGDSKYAPSAWVKEIYVA